MQNKKLSITQIRQMVRTEINLHQSNVNSGNHQTMNESISHVMRRSPAIKALISHHVQESFSDLITEVRRPASYNMTFEVGSPVKVSHEGLRDARVSGAPAGKGFYAGEVLAIDNIDNSLEVQFTDPSSFSAFVGQEFAWLEGSEPGGRIDQAARDPAPEEEALQRAIDCESWSWLDDVVAHEVGKTVKAEFMKMVLSQFGTPADQGVLGTAIVMIFAELDLFRMMCYLDNKGKGPERLAALTIRVVIDILGKELPGGALAELLGLKKGVGLSDTLINFVTLTLSEDFVESDLGKELTEKLAAVIRAADKEWIFELTTWMKEKWDLVMANPIARALADTYEKMVIAFSDWVDQNIPDSVQKVLGIPEAYDRIDYLGFQAPVLSSHRMLTSQELNLMIREEQVRHKRLITEVAFLVPLIISLLAIPAAAAGALYYNRKKILNYLDTTSIGQTIKRILADKLVVKIGGTPDVGLIGRWIPAIFQKVKLADYEMYIGEEKADIFAELLVDSLAQILTDETSKLFQEFLGIKDTTTPIGGAILTFIQTALAMEMSEGDFGVMLKKETADFFRNIDTDEILEDLKKVTGDSTDIKISILQDILGLGD